MASYSVGATEVGAWEKTLVAATVDTVTFARDCTTVRVVNVSGAAAIYFRLGTTAPTVAGAASYWLPAVAGASRTIEVDSGDNTVVKVISAGTPSYSVEGSLS